MSLHPIKDSSDDERSRLEKLVEEFDKKLEQLTESDPGYIELSRDRQSIVEMMERYGELEPVDHGSQTGSFQSAGRASKFTAVILVLVGSICCLMSYTTVYFNPWNADWRSCSGTVTGVVQASVRTINGREISYSYVVGGSELSGSQAFTLYGENLSPGDDLNIRYNPGNPSESAIQTGLNIATVVWSVVAASFFMLGFWVFRSDI